MRNNGGYSTTKKRLDLEKKISGEAEFLDDLSFPGMLHALVLRLPHAQVKIMNINIDEALNVTGIEKIITGNDVSNEVINIDIVDQKPLAVDKVRYMGEPEVWINGQLKSSCVN